MGLFDLLRRHFFDHFFQRDRRVGIAANCAERIPHISAGKVGCGHAPADFVIPANAGLRARMPFHRAAQIPFKGAFIIAGAAKPHRIHDADQFLRIRIAGPRCRPERVIGRSKISLFHQVARLFDLCKGRRGHQYQGKGKFAHLLVLLCLSAAPLRAELPAPITPADFHDFDPLQAELGQLLFYDKILSGNRNISCGTCHHHDLGGSDGLSLGIGEGGEGLGPDRTAGEGQDRIRKRIPRNAPALWNLGHRSVDVMFHDGRLSVSDLYGNGFNSPAEEWLPEGLEIILAAQAVFPLVAQFEMAGNPRENEVAGAVHDRIDAAWPIIAKRVRVIPEYGDRFVAAFDHISAPEEVTIVEIANALAAFMGTEWQSYDSPFDAFLAGDEAALSDAQRRGLELFYGNAGCAKCHSGPLLMDQEFHALGLPPFGPGRTRRFDPMVRDVGRMGETDDLADAYRFRTPSLRNVTLTAPYGHNGAYPTLEGIVRHHLDPVEARAGWTRDLAALPEVPWLAPIDFVVQEDRFEMERQAAVLDIDPMRLTDDQVSDIIAFLGALTGYSAESLPLGRPDRVPSGLPVD